jgi:hypothetical protein
MKHSPAPWKVYDSDTSTIYIGTVSTEPDAGWKHEVICDLHFDASDNYEPWNDYQSYQNATANARLIAAAPDLLDALQQAVSFPITGDWYETAAAAIAKATMEDV